MVSKAEQTAATHYLQFNIQWASIALLYYDYALTLPSEIKYIWGSKFRLSTVLYVLCRYALAANVIYLLAISHHLGQGDRCDVWYKVLGVLSTFGRGAVIVTFTARTYAIYGGNKWILAYLSTVGLTCFILDFMHVPGLKCVGSSSIQIANNLLSILMVVFEFSSAILTFFRSVQTFKTAGPWRNQRSGLIFLIFRQGALYFGIISLFTTAAVILNFRAPAGFLQRLLNAFTLPLSGLLTARFLLHMRKWENKHSHSDTINDLSASQQQATLGGFRAAAAPGVLSTIIEDFGQDPVASAHSSSRTAAGAGSSGNVIV